MTRRNLAGLATFALVGFGVPWLGWWWIDNTALNLWLFPLFCSVAGFAAAYAEGGRAGFAAFCRRVLRVRRVPRYVLLAACIPLALGLAYLLATGLSPSALVFSPSALMGLTLGAALVTGPLAEEFGWRGYLQHRLGARVAPFWAALAVALVWWVWHIPLFRDSVFATPRSALMFLAYLVTWSVFMIFLVRRAGGSVWPAVAFHWAANTHADVLRVLLPSVDGSLLPGGSKSVLFYLLIAAAFVVLNHRFFFAAPRPAPAGARDTHATWLESTP